MNPVSERILNKNLLTKNAASWAFNASDAASHAFNACDAASHALNASDPASTHWTRQMQYPTRWTRQMQRSTRQMQHPTRDMQYLTRYSAWDAYVIRWYRLVAGIPRVVPCETCAPHVLLRVSCSMPRVWCVRCSISRVTTREMQYPTRNNAWDTASYAF